MTGGGVAAKKVTLKKKLTDKGSREKGDPSPDKASFWGTAIIRGVEEVIKKYEKDRQQCANFKAAHRGARECQTKVLRVGRIGKEGHPNQGGLSGDLSKDVENKKKDFFRFPSRGGETRRGQL